MTNLQTQLDAALALSAELARLLKARVTQVAELERQLANSDERCKELAMELQQIADALSAPKPEAKPVAWMLKFADGSLDNIALERRESVEEYIQDMLETECPFYQGAQSFPVYTHPPADEQMKRDAERVLTHVSVAASARLLR